MEVDLSSITNPNQEEIFQIFPNPSNGEVKLFIQREYVNVIDIHFYDNLGRQIATYNTNQIIDLKNFESGIYYFILETFEGKSYAKKLVLIK